MLFFRLLGLATLVLSLSLVCEALPAQAVRAPCAPGKLSIVFIVRARSVLRGSSATLRARAPLGSSDGGGGGGPRGHARRHARHTRHDTRAGDVRGHAGWSTPLCGRSGGGRVRELSAVVLRAGGGARRRRGGVRDLQPRLLELDASRALPGGPVRCAGGTPRGRRPSAAAPPVSDSGSRARVARGLARAGGERAGARLLRGAGRARPAGHRGPHRHAPGRAAHPAPRRAATAARDPLARSAITRGHLTNYQRIIITCLQHITLTVVSNIRKRVTNYFILVTE